MDIGVGRWSSSSCSLLSGGDPMAVPWLLAGGIITSSSVPGLCESGEFVASGFISTSIRGNGTYKRFCVFKCGHAFKRGCSRCDRGGCISKLSGGSIGGGTNSTGLISLGDYATSPASAVI